MGWISINGKLIGGPSGDDTDENETVEFGEVNGVAPTGYYYEPKHKGGGKMLNWLTKLKERNKARENVHYMHTADCPVDRVLEATADAGLESVTVVGWDKDGKFIMITSHAKCKDLLWDLNIGIREIMG